MSRVQLRKQFLSLAPHAEKSLRRVSLPWFNRRQRTEKLSCSPAPPPPSLLILESLSWPVSVLCSHTPVSPRATFLINKHHHHHHHQQSLLITPGWVGVLRWRRKCAQRRQEDPCQSWTEAPPTRPPVRMPSCSVQDSIGTQLALQTDDFYGASHASAAP